MSKKEEESAYESLSPRHRRFVDAYFEHELRAGPAYLAVYKCKPSTAETSGPTLLRNPQVAAAVGERMEEDAMPAREVLYRLAQQASGSAEDFLVFERRQRQEPRWVPVAVAIEEKRLEVEVERETQRRLELKGKQAKAADEALAKLEAELVRLEVLQETDPGRLVKIDGPVEEVTAERIDLQKMKRARRLGLVKSVKHDKDGGVKVELYDAKAALELIGRHHKLFTDRHEHTGPGGGPIQVSEVTDADRLERLEALRRRVEKAPGNSDS